ncbi:MAG: mammalian cell entry protein [Simplicispira suum]|uniref:MlaD family protein n=1 Tax=Simplicispira suum TaxID=2109915 RepID=UPI001C6ABD77|nr:mammalian cell entry protein [Simplicispira suum]MBW7831671.1 mammalian cell entry protein [Simplicispira suum]
MTSPSPPEPMAAELGDAELIRPVVHLRLKAFALLFFTLLLVVGSALYLMVARGAFEPTQRLVLIADDSEGVVVGMDMTFSGFPIGRVRRIELGGDGTARILIDVPQKDAHWLRVSSVFTLVRGIVGGTGIRAYTGMLEDAPLPDGAERPVLRGDATAEIPQLMSSARELLGNLNALTAADSALGTSLGNVATLTERLQGPGGALGMLLGSETDAKKIVQTLDRTNALLARIDRMAARADEQVFGAQGVMPEARATVVELRKLLADARASLTKVDAVLVQAQAVGANVAEGTADLDALRADVEASLRKVDGLVNEINRRWPFARDKEIVLP